MILFRFLFAPVLLATAVVGLHEGSPRAAKPCLPPALSPIAVPAAPMGGPSLQPAHGPARRPVEGRFDRY